MFYNLCSEEEKLNERGREREGGREGEGVSQRDECEGSEWYIGVRRRKRMTK